MNKTLDPQSRSALITYRIQRAEETLGEAEYNALGGYYNTAINRLYYAAFYAANAILISRGIECNSHAGVKSMISLHFVKPGLLDIEHGKTLNQLFLNRQAGDYEDFIYCDKELYDSLKPKTESFISAIKNFLGINRQQAEL